MTFTRPKVVSEDVKLSERAQASKVGYNRKADATGRRLGCDFMNAGTLAGNDSLRAALRHYDEVRETYLRALAEHGVEFAPAGSSDAEIAQLRDELAQRGAEFRNAGASIRVGWISKACIECTGNKGSETFSTTFRCHRDCYFCFNHNQADYDKFVREGCPWEEGLARAAETYKNGLHRAHGRGAAFELRCVNRVPQPRTRAFPRGAQAHVYLGRPADRGHDAGAA